MVSKMRAHLSYRNITGTLALFIALGGVSWAAVNLSKNSVGPREIEKDAVGAAEIAKNAVRSGEVKNGSLQCVDLKPSEPACGPDAVGLTNTTVRASTEPIPWTTCTQGPGMGDFAVNCTGEGTIKASCNPGERATGGGYLEPMGSAGSGRVRDDRPDPTAGTPDGWAVRATADGSNHGPTAPVAEPPNVQVTVYAVCAA